MSPEPRPRLLLVEDNPMNIRLATRWLERLGFELEVAHDGLGALKAVQTQAPDAVLMDLGLPKLDGWATTRCLRAIPAFADLPIIAVTAHAMAADLERARDSGCDACVTKPVDFPALGRQIRALIQARSQASPC